MATITRLAGMQDVPDPQDSSTAITHPDPESQLHVVPQRPSRAALPLPIERQRSSRSTHSGSSRASNTGSQGPSVVPALASQKDSTSTAVASHDQSQQQNTYTATRDDPSPIPQEHPDEITWGPKHPCFPHPNPHVAKTSPEYSNTRVIRIARDYLVAGDLYPQFQNVYPEILSELLSENEFRTALEEINGRLRVGLDPGGARAVVDALMGAFTGFLWDDLGATKTKSAMKGLEDWMEDWNRKRAGEGREVKLIPLRRTGFMNLDIQIPDPGIDVGSSEDDHQS